jgi:ribosome-associated toxin RatA of RatAB toxin-antitoxin module
MELVRGPFTRLIGRWRFEPIGEQGSRVEFHVEFEFKNRLMALALNPVFESVCDKIVDSFVLRARAVYGAAPRESG